jgi:hypothetical protein
MLHLCQDREVLDLKGLREGMSNQMRHTKGLTQEGNDKTHNQKTGDQLANLIFLSKLYTKEEET